MPPSAQVLLRSVKARVARSNAIQLAEVGAILDKGHAKTSAEDASHPVRRPGPQSKATAFSGRSLPSSIMRAASTRTLLDELVGTDPGRLDEMSVKFRALIPTTAASDPRVVRLPMLPMTLFCTRAIGDSGSAGSVR
jgi:hypothetical protein